MTRMQRLRVELPAVIALGSNLGDREATLRAAVAAIGAIPGVKLTGASGIVESAALKPTGVDEDAPSYLNAVVTVRSAIAPQDLLDALRGIENDLGRERLERWGDRTIDLDIIDAGGATMATDTLTLPHPRAAQRAFVLAPWLQIDPEAVLVGWGRVADLLEAATDTVREFPSRSLLPDDGRHDAQEPSRHAGMPESGGEAAR